LNLTVNTGVGKRFLKYHLMSLLPTGKGSFFVNKRRKAVIVNGKEIVLQKEISIVDFLEKEGYDTTKVAVEKNGGIVPKKNFDSEILSDIDKIEIVSFVGGG